MSQNYILLKFLEENTAELQGKKKIIWLIQNIIDSSSFQKSLKKLREAFDIPENGIKDVNEKKLFFQDKDTSYPLYLPKIVTEKVDKNTQLFIIRKISNEMYSFAKKAGISSQDVKKVLVYYFYFDDLECLDVKEVNEAFSIRNSLGITETKSLEESFLTLPPESFIEHLRNFQKKYPFAIHISQETTWNDFKDFFENNWKELKALALLFEDKYDDKSLTKGYKTRNKIITERNSFILKNKHLPTKEIRKLLIQKSKENGHIYKNIYLVDDGTINSIISKHRKKENMS